MIPFLRFILDSLHHRLQAPGGEGGQCVDLPNCYLQAVWGLPGVRANAVDWQSARIKRFTWTPNGPSNFPQPGSIVVWRPTSSLGIGAAGHIALAVDADNSLLLTFDQNWPTGSGCEFVPHSYVGVAGWHEPPMSLR